MYYRIVHRESYRSLAAKIAVAEAKAAAQHKHKRPVKSDVRHRGELSHE